MSKKKTSNPDGIVYSTNPGFQLHQPEEQINTLPPAQQKLRIRLDTKQRAGKAVTLVTGFAGREDDAQELGRKLKAFCGTGGSVKDLEIIVQGDQRDKVLQWLKNNGYSAAKKM
ncbi:MAG: translation initiation factor [Williamsia sp.]|nr:translation initiation factor [Williamsia sp.]